MLEIKLTCKKRIQFSKFKKNFDPELRELYTATNASLCQYHQPVLSTLLTLFAFKPWKEFPK